MTSAASTPAQLAELRPHLTEPGATKQTRALELNSGSASPLRSTPWSLKPPSPGPSPTSVRGSAGRHAFCSIAQRDEARSEFTQPAEEPHDLLFSLVSALLGQHEAPSASSILQLSSRSSEKILLTLPPCLQLQTPSFKPAFMTCQYSRLRREGHSWTYLKWQLQRSPAPRAQSSVTLCTPAQRATDNRGPGSQDNSEK